MLIAFEGPDKTGKSTSAANLSSDGEGVYNMRDDTYRVMRNADPGTVTTFDRIDWMTHQVYRLAMPRHEWNDKRVRTVFSAPDVHLVFKLHNEDSVGYVKDELYEQGSPLEEVNQMYRWWAEYIMGVNALKGYTLFKSVSILEVTNQPTESFSQRMIMFDSPAFEFGSVAERLVQDDESLLELLRHAEQHSL